MALTLDPNDDRLHHGVDETPLEDQHEVYLVASETERAHRCRPLRLTYVHALELGGCGSLTSMSVPIAQTFAADPTFYGSTFCIGCKMHRPVGEHGEFYWIDTTEKVGT